MKRFFYSLSKPVTFCWSEVGTVEDMERIERLQFQVPNLIFLLLPWKCINNGRIQRGEEWALITNNIQSYTNT